MTLPALVQSKKKACVVVIAVAFLLRLAFAFEAGTNPVLDTPTLDSITNNAIAVFIAENGGYPKQPYAKAPLYYYFLAGIYSLFGLENFQAVRIIQALLSALTCALLLLIAWRRFGRLVGWLTGILASLFWTPVFFSADLLDTSLSLFVYTCALFSLLNLKSNWWPKWILVGVFFGLGMVLRPVYGLFVLLLASHLAFVALWQRHWRRLLSLGLFIISLSAVVAPFLIRNYQVSERAGLSYYWSMVLYQGNRLNSNGKDPSFEFQFSQTIINEQFDLYQNPMFIDNIVRETHLVVSEYLGRKAGPWEVADYYLNQTLGEIRSDPFNLAPLYWKKLSFFFNASEYPNNRMLNYIRGEESVILGLLPVGSGFLLPLVLMGMVLSYKRQRRNRGLYAFLLSGFLLTLLAFINARYRVVVLFFAIPFAAQTILFVWQRLRELYQKRTMTLTTYLAFAGIVNLAILVQIDFFHYSRVPYVNLLSSFVSQYEAKQSYETIDPLRSYIRRQGRGLVPSSYRAQKMMSLLAMLDAMQGRNQDSLKKLEVVMNNGGGVRDAYRLAADIYEASGDNKAATLMLKSGLSRFPDDVWLRLRLARMTGNKAKLLEAISHAHRMFPWRAHHHRSLVDVAKAAIYLFEKFGNDDHLRFGKTAIQRALRIKSTSQLEELANRYERALSRGVR